jgi:hypothetical protein
MCRQGLRNVSGSGFVGQRASGYDRCGEGGEEVWGQGLTTKGHESGLKSEIRKKSEFTEGNEGNKEGKIMGAKLLGIPNLGPWQMGDGKGQRGEDRWETVAGGSGDSLGFLSSGISLNVAAPAVVFNIEDLTQTGHKRRDRAQNGLSKGHVDRDTPGPR